MVEPSSNAGLTRGRAATKHVPPGIEQVQFLIDKRPVPFGAARLQPELIAQTHARSSRLSAAAQLQIGP
jgi:hypothetical protein